MEWVRTKSSDCDIIFCVSGQSCYTIMTHVGADASCESLATCCTDNFIQAFVTFSTHFLPVKQRDLRLIFFPFEDISRFILIHVLFVVGKYNGIFRCAQQDILSGLRLPITHVLVFELHILSDNRIQEP